MEEMNRRERILSELELTPLWLERQALRQTASSSVAALSENSQQISAQSAESQATVSVAEMDWVALEDATAKCEACALHKGRKQAVLGVGDKEANWLFVGEAPGADEDSYGEPFVGQAGRLLDNMLSAIGLRRGADVYIANVVKCRPPGNRNPTQEETRACAPFLDRQIALIRPRLIVALGKVAATTLLGHDGTIGSFRNSVHDYRGIPLLVTYHPAYLLRTLTDKAKAWEDLCFAVETMSDLRGAAHVAD